MSFRLRLAAWFALSFLVLAGLLLLTAHWHLDEELRRDRWDRSHPQFPNWVIHGSYTDEEVKDILGELLQVWMWVGIPVALAALAVGYHMARRSLHPVRQINRELDALQPRSLQRGITSPEQDRELGALVDHLNDLLARVGKSYGEMEEFSMRVAHELRTPLAILRMKLEEAAPDLPADFSEEMQEELARLSRLVDRSLLAARAEGGKIEVSAARVDVSAVLEEMREDYALPADEGGLRLEWYVPAGLACTADGEFLRQILHNLLGNALRHGCDRMRVSARLHGPGGGAVVRITNQAPAPGMAAPGGMGIGLRLVRALAASMPGARFRDRRLGGVFSVRLSLAA